MRTITTSIDWKIHKRLLDAGGIGDTVYICSGRANNKTEIQRKIVEELLAKGKTVIQLPLEARTKPAPVPDFDLERPHWIVEALTKACDELKKRSEYVPIPEYEMFKDFYVLDKTKDATPYLHWIKSNPYYTTRYSKDEEDDDGL